jgi:hypothetical protein
MGEGVRNELRLAEDGKTDVKMLVEIKRKIYLPSKATSVADLETRSDRLVKVCKLRICYRI